MNRVVTSMTLPQGVVEHLRTLIHRGEVGPGERLPSERELAEQLGVARISLREAIKILQDEGYVEVRRGSRGGTFVTELHRPVERWRSRMREQAGEIDGARECRAVGDVDARADLVGDDVGEGGLAFCSGVLYG
jgi:GntR family transcriptional regulator, transcriptional repressor for pyruvate dehydrogenase complex